MTFDVGFLAQNQIFTAGFLPSVSDFDTTFSSTTGIAYVESYKGSYTATPAAEDQILATKNKLMSDDVTLEAVPRYDVENTSGGRTVTIGG